ncbi:MAG: cytochrome C biogenesis protein [Proteobacteria bacterium HN_bin10]|nr:MAG: cytochrome C biogenesis protein [Proteobacteria bacterium HN_bin10]
MEYKDYYKILGVERTATADDIKKAYRKLARTYHPDVSKEAGAEARFKEIGEAYEVLQDPQKRAAYDQLGTRWQAGQDFTPPPDWGTGFEFTQGRASREATPDFSDFFSSLFGNFARQADASRARGEDHHAKILIPLEDAFHGATRTITLRAPQLDAQGRVVLREHTLNIRIPKGIRDGQLIRLAGQGTPGTGGAPGGDLYLEIHFDRHALYRVEGHDLSLTLPLAPWEAALGATVKAPTPTGVVEVKVPAGSQSGRKLRLKGRGIPGEPPGDLYLVLDVVLPKADTARAQELYRTMAQELSFNPRRALGV